MAHSVRRPTVILSAVPRDVIQLDEQGIQIQMIAGADIPYLIEQHFTTDAFSNPGIIRFYDRLSVGVEAEHVEQEHFRVDRLVGCGFQLDRSFILEECD